MTGSLLWLCCFLLSLGGNGTQLEPTLNGKIRVSMGRPLAAIRVLNELCLRL